MASRWSSNFWNSLVFLYLLGSLFRNLRRVLILAIEKRKVLENRYI